MSDNKEEAVPSDAASLMASIEKEFAKQATSGVKAKLLELMKKKKELERSIRLVDVDINKVVADWKAGIL